MDPGLGFGLSIATALSLLTLAGGLRVIFLSRNLEGFVIGCLLTEVGGVAFFFIAQRFYSAV